MRYLVIIFFIFIVFNSAAQKLNPTSTDDFVMDCMKTTEAGSDKQMALWFPYNFWQLIGERMKSSSDFTQYITDEMSNYMMFAVVDYHITSSGVIFKSEEEIRKSIKLYDSAGNVYAPLDNKDISPSAIQLLKNFQPVMAQMLGQFGEGMRVFLFESKKKNGEPAIDVSKTNSFTLNWGSTGLKWILPFASVLPPKYCPVDKEQMKGNWNYCPVHGVKLDN